MKWRMADVIDHYVPWRRIAGRKAVSLEEYDLLAPLGRTETIPETLVIESAVAFGRWLVMASSEFTDSAVLDSVEEWRVHRTAGRGDVLHVTVTMDENVEQASRLVPPAAFSSADTGGTPVPLSSAMGEGTSGARLSPLPPSSSLSQPLSLSTSQLPSPLPVCAHVADAGGEAVADGRLMLLRVPLAELIDPEAMRLMWAELNRK